jgi:hypothetical protein
VVMGSTCFLNFKLDFLTSYEGCDNLHVRQRMLCQNGCCCFWQWVVLRAIVAGGVATAL